MFWLKFKIKM